MEYTLTLKEVSASERDQVGPARAASDAAAQRLQSIDKRVDSRLIDWIKFRSIRLVLGRRSGATRKSA